MAPSTGEVRSDSPGGIACWFIDTDYNEESFFVTSPGRGASGTLRINYRTSHQIRAQADRLLGRQVSDVDGNTEERGGTISVFNGPDRLLRVLERRGRVHGSGPLAGGARVRGG